MITKQHKYEEEEGVISTLKYFVNLIKYNPNSREQNPALSTGSSSQMGRKNSARDESGSPEGKD